MAKKCAKCHAPIEGFWAKISAWAGVKQSTKYSELCNKCEKDKDEELAKSAPVETPVAPVETEDIFKDDIVEPKV